MRTIPLSQGLEALVDDEDFETLTKFKWHAEVRSNTSYAVHTYRVLGKVNKIYMHHKITGYRYVDHKNHNGLDNRRENLLKSNSFANMARSRGRRSSSSTYKGVSWDNRQRAWMVNIKRRGVVQFKKQFRDELYAALVYDREILRIDGPLAVTNFYYVVPTEDDP